MCRYPREVTPNPSYMSRRVGISEAWWCLSPLLTMVYHKCLAKIKQPKYRQTDRQIDESWEYVIKGKILCHTLNDYLALSLQLKIQEGVYKYIYIPVRKFEITVIEVFKRLISQISFKFQNKAWLDCCSLTTHSHSGYFIITIIIIRT